MLERMISGELNQRMSFCFLRASFARALVCTTLAACTVLAADWPQWRGPDRNGISPEKDWLDQWPDQGPKIAWKGRVGLGYSSVVVAEGRVYTVGFANEQDTVFCFDAAAGKEIWKHSYPSELGDKYFQGGTTGTPTIDGNRLYWLSRWGDLYCYNASNGKILWNKNIQKETGAALPDWGFTGAPLVHENLLILNVGDNGVAVEKATGNLVWASSKKKAGYSTPLPFQEKNKTLVAIGSASGYIAVDPKTGEEAWRIRWITEYGVNASDPIITPNRIFLSTGYGKGAGLFDRANLDKPIWQNKVLRTQLNPAVLHDGHVYGVDGDTTERGRLKCVELATGQEKWVENNFGSGGVIIANGKLIALSAQGELMVAPVTPSGFKPTARAQVLGGTSWTAPVLANGRVYCRNSRGDLVCVDLRKQ
jgi:outer membrane protein assembly factor BamB